MPKQMDRIVDDFVQPGYTRKDVSMEWHLKTYFDSFMIIIAMFVASYYINIINQRLGIVFKILGMYYLIDLLLFQWNYKSYPLSYYSLILVTTIIIVCLFIPLKKDKTYAKIIQFLDTKNE